MCEIKNRSKGHVLARIDMMSNNMFPMCASSVVSHSLVTSKASETQVWHLKYGHLHERGLRLLVQKQMVRGLPKINNLHFCETCVHGKQSRGSFPTGQAVRAQTCLELVHIDLCGPMSIDSLGGSRYFMLLVDDYSRFNWVYFLKNKSEAFECFRTFKTLVENQSGKRILRVRSDRGGEFTSRQFNVFYESAGIHRELMAAYTPEQNGVVERKNRTVVEMACSML